MKHHYLSFCKLDRPKETTGLLPGHVDINVKANAQTTCTVLQVFISLWNQVLLLLFLKSWC